MISYVCYRLQRKETGLSVISLRCCRNNLSMNWQICRKDFESSNLLRKRINTLWERFPCVSLIVCWIRFLYKWTAGVNPHIHILRMKVCICLGSVIDVNIRSDQTVMEAKGVIGVSQGTNPSSIKLIYKGHLLQNNHHLYYYGRYGIIV